MKRALLKDTLAEIKNTHKRFISILLIILLGAGFFAGIKAVKTDMKKAADNYYDESHFMDFQLISTLGITKDDVEKIADESYAQNVMPSTTIDAVINIEDEESVVKISTLPANLDESNENYLNRLNVVEGNLPKNQDECVTEKRLLENTELKVGDYIQINEQETKDSEKFKTKRYKIVGLVTSPTYMSSDRGTTSLGNGNVSSFMYVPETSIDREYYTELYLTINGAKELNTTNIKYSELIKASKDNLEYVTEQRGVIRYNEIVGEAKTKIDEAKTELANSRNDVYQELANGENEINKAKITLANAQNELNENTIKANSEFSNAQLKLERASVELNNQEQLLNEKQAQAEPMLEQAKRAIAMLEGNISNIQNAIQANTQIIQEQKDIKKNKQENIVELQDKIANSQDIDEKEQLQKEIDALAIEIDEIDKKIEVVQNENLTNSYTISVLQDNLQKTRDTLDENIQKLQHAKMQIENGKKELNNQKTLFETTKSTTYEKLNSAKIQIQKGRDEIAVNEDKLATSRNQADTKFAEAQTQIDDAEAKLSEIKEPQWYLLDRNSTKSYVSYMQDADRIGAIAEVFPLIFFVVAALVSLTSMTRMVEEQRGQIGTLKALGYNKMQIASKYLWYASIASLVGSVIGICIGFKIIPGIVFDVYKMMYNMPPEVSEFNMKYAILAVAISVLCTTLATLFACIKELAETPASLMRPKAPKAGKRVLLEKIPFIWKHLNFTAKVTARNILRYKKRFFMTVIGIGGCTALILTGFGLRDSIMTIAPNQYEMLSDYELSVALKDKITDEQLQTFSDKLKENENITGMIKTRQQTVTFVANGKSEDGQLEVIEDNNNFDEYVHLRNRKTQEKYELQDGKVILTEKMANKLGVKAGDSITLKNDDGEVEVEISAITENYIYHYVYMSQSTYNKLYDKDVKFNNLFVKVNELSKEEEEAITKDILSNEYIGSSSFITGISQTIKEAMNSLNYVVLVLIVSAGLLAFIVLYNLSNVNISERKRELATIKVLGFYDLEVSEYVYRENVILTAVGTAVGLLFGYFLNSYIIQTCEVDMVMFSRNIEPLSFLYAVIITFIFALIVNIVTHFSLKKIDMIESLKSVE